MSTNAFMVVDGTKEDVRCDKCRHHKYVILSNHESGLSVLHTFAHILQGRDFPYLSKDQGLHWWGRGIGVTDSSPPICLGSYKKIGGK